MNIEDRVYDKYDTFEKVAAGCRAMHKLMILLHDRKPLKGSPEEKAWEEEIAEARKWAIDLNYRGIQLCVKMQKQLKLERESARC